MPSKFAFLLLLVILSCTMKPNSNERVDDDDLKHNCGQFLGLGELVDETYSFCSIVPVENQYSYKRGKWKFWDTEGVFVADVEFVNAIDTIVDHGGCDYYMITETLVSTSHELDSDVKMALEKCNCFRKPVGEVIGPSDIRNNPLNL